jgi:hypothetical protein
MTLSSAEVIVGGSANLYLAATGATDPGGTAAPGTAWTECGYMTDAGATFNLNRTTTDLLVWQSLDPVRKITTAQVNEVDLVLRQFDSNNLKFALGGGSVAAGTPGTYSFPQAGENVERAVILDVFDSGTQVRFYWPRMSVSGNVSVALNRSDSMNLPLTLQSLSSTVLPQIRSTLIT